MATKPSSVDNCADLTVIRMKRHVVRPAANYVTQTKVSYN